MSNNTRSAYSLGLNKRSAMALLLDLRDSLTGSFSVELNRALPVNEGFYKYDEKKAFVGVKALSGQGLGSLTRVPDIEFTRAVVALYHEYGHHVDNVGMNTPKEIILSAISTFHNRGYRINGASEFPHEISAERTGVLYAYDTMGKLFGSRGRACVLDYMRDKIINTTYVLKVDDVPSAFIDPNNAEDALGWMRDDLDVMFDKAMSRSLERKREPQPGLRRYEHDRMSEFFKRPEGIPYFRKFIDEVPGAVKDRMAASVNIHIDPDLMDPRLDPEDVDMDAAFGMPGPSERSPLMQRCFNMSESRPGQPRSDMQGPDP